MPDIRHAIPIDAPREKVYPLVASGPGITNWWAADVVEEQSGRVAELGFFNRSTIYRLQLVRAVAPSETEWLCQTGAEWQNTRLVFQLSQNKSQTLVRFTHAGWQHQTDLLHFLQHHLGRVDVPAEGRGGGQDGCATFFGDGTGVLR
jgi:uncharacterized protein YndB with AHSA1/START domain